MITLSSCKYYEKSQTVEMLYSTEYNQGPLSGHNRTINDREDSHERVHLKAARFCESLFTFVKPACLLST